MLPVTHHVDGTGGGGAHAKAAGGGSSLHLSAGGSWSIAAQPHAQLWTPAPGAEERRLREAGQQQALDDWSAREAAAAAEEALVSHAGRGRRCVGFCTAWSLLRRALNFELQEMRCRH